MPLVPVFIVPVFIPASYANPLKILQYFFMIYPMNIFKFIFVSLYLKKRSSIN